MIYLVKSTQLKTKKYRTVITNELGVVHQVSLDIRVSRARYSPEQRSLHEEPLYH